jgi:hypothetical protein
VGTQAAVLAVVVLVLAGAIVGITLGASGGSGGGSSSSSGLTAAGSSSVVPVSQASTSTRGVAPDGVTVVFPIVNLTALSAQQGFGGDIEFQEQTDAINTYVNDVNAHGGIAGRRIKPMIVSYDPTNQADMRAKCKDWTVSTPVFAVVEGVGAWTGDNQLCITQEGSTPFIGQWTTISNWTQRGSPYLWWTGVDQSAMLRTVVAWGKQAGLLAPGKKLGIVVGDRASDQLALNQYVLPYLKQAGLPQPVVETLATNPTDTATIQAQAPLVVQRLRAAGAQSVIPLIPFNSFYVYLQSETQQQYFPRLVLSDYESTINIGLGLIPAPYEKALDGQLGATVQTLGGIDDDRPQSQGGYDPGLRSCFDTWKQTHAVPPFIEEQGPIASWCQSIRLFADAANRAGPNLDRRSFVQAMAATQNFPGTLTPTLSYSTNKFYGPTSYQVVRLHNNDPNNNQCILKNDGGPQGTCWQVVQGWTPLVTG